MIAALFSLAAHQAMAAQRTPIDRVRIAVNHDVITQRDIDSYKSLQTRQLSRQLSGQELRNALAEFEKNIQEQMIMDLLLEREAEKMGLKVDEREIDEKMEAILAKEPDILKIYSEEELKSFLAKDQLRRQVVEEEISSHVHVGDEDVIAACQKETGQDTEYHVGHILIRGHSNEALTRIQELRKRLMGGASFEDMAALQSEDPSAASNGGDLGFIGKGQLLPEFEAGAFALKNGEISQPVKTQYGYHLIKMYSSRKGAAEQCRTLNAYQRGRWVQKIIQDQWSTRKTEYLSNLRKKSIVKFFN
ncbi:MAG: peptidylprolyl isomerase [Deltaproteobacteria bacterium]|nr:peptidylprolyl isomerase [Deltaproteobacteria bacterium]